MDTLYPMRGSIPCHGARSSLKAFNEKSWSQSTYEFRQIRLYIVLLDPRKKLETKISTWAFVMCSLGSIMLSGVTICNVTLWVFFCFSYIFFVVPVNFLTLSQLTIHKFLFFCNERATFEFPWKVQEWYSAMSKFLWMYFHQFSLYCR